MKKITFVIFSTVVLMILTQTSAYACGCVTVGNPTIEQQVKNKLADSLVAFRGEVTKIDPRNDGHSYNEKFNVAEYWKGTPNKELTLITKDSSCQYPFEAGEKYLVYAYIWEDVLTANVCIGNLKLENAADEVKILGKGREPENKVEKLSKKGKEAFTKLYNARQFSIGLVGWEAEQSENEKALRVLLAEKRAKDALISLIHNGSPEGSLYGLFGLRMNTPKSFNRELKYYKSKPEPPERLQKPNQTASRQLLLNGFNKIKAGQVLVEHGRVIMNTPLKEVVSSIEAGKYDEEFRLNKTSEYIITTSSCGFKKN